MPDINEKIRNEYESMRHAIFPSEKRQHAKRLAELERERDAANITIWEAYQRDEDAREDGE